MKYSQIQHKVELFRLKLICKEFQEVLTAMHEAGFKPTISVFQGIIYAKFRGTKGRGQGNAMSDYLKSETVKATPAIKRALRLYDKLDDSEEFLKLVFEFQIEDDTLVKKA